MGFDCRYTIFYFLIQYYLYRIRFTAKSYQSSFNGLKSRGSIEFQGN